LLTKMIEPLQTNVKTHEDLTQHGRKVVDHNKGSNKPLRRG
jgi:hypothetical protein